MDAVAIAVVAGGLGVVAGTVLGFRVAASRTRSAGGLGGRASDDVALDRQLIQALPTPFLVLGPGEEVLMGNRLAQRAGLVDGLSLTHSELGDLVRRVRREQRSAQREITQDERSWCAQAVPIDADRVALVVEDTGEARRVEALRRDFIANTGHELKTPVGALGLLAEAVGEAADDPIAVRHFAARMEAEASRLSRLVQDVIELSRVQGASSDSHQPVPVDRVLAESVDRNLASAAAKRIQLTSPDAGDLTVRGDEHQLVSALTNLVDNAVTYSPAGTKVVVAAASRAHHVEISVTDEGPGIPAAEQQRIFERFYRVDPARSRDTGGTGLGLAIVKHIAQSHGGEVAVWSREGLGSTFTLRLPQPDAEGAP